MEVITMEWELPDELNMPTPRKIYKLPIFTKQLVWIFGALIFFGILPVLIISAIFLFHIHTFEAQGQVTVAHIDKSYLVKERHGWNCIVEYSFLNKEGVLIGGNKYSYGNINCSKTTDRNIRIYYLNNKYSSNVPIYKNREDKNYIIKFVYLFSGMIIFSGCYIYLRKFIQLRKEAKLMRLGCATQGWITESTIKRKNHWKFLRVYGIYRDSAGEIYNFQKDFSIMYGDDGKYVLEKAKINTTILYCPDQHDSNIMYPPEYIGFSSE
ncbi:hypothetical protein [Gluconobacter japonicus]|uniref:hypothetical protein n=1 Tax=Gluconobacter japonicus TaxID=376620 RepID=UPI0007817348|nr:hypothetical protein [Gluconobacter japonicus]KXV20819.1 hypothetical protein AD935_10390 [Gluconobacter japonicus]